MPFASMQAYLERMPARMAEMKLAISEAVSIPHMVERDQRDLLDAWRAQAEMKTAQAEAASPAVLKLMGIGVVRSHPKP